MRKLEEKAIQLRKQRVMKELKKLVVAGVVSILVFVLSIVGNNCYYEVEESRLYKEVDNFSIYKGEILGYNRETWGKRNNGDSFYIYFKPDCPEEIITETDNTGGSDNSITAGPKLFGSGVIRLQLAGSKLSEFEDFYYYKGREQLKDSEDIITFYTGGNLLKGVGEIESFYYYEGVWALNEEDLISFTIKGSSIGVLLFACAIFSFVTVIFCIIGIIEFTKKHKMDLKLNHTYHRG